MAGNRIRDDDDKVVATIDADGKVIQVSDGKHIADVRNGNFYSFPDGALLGHQRPDLCRDRRCVRRAKQLAEADAQVVMT